MELQSFRGLGDMYPGFILNLVHILDLETRRSKTENQIS